MRRGQSLPNTTRVMAARRLCVLVAKRVRSYGRLYTDDAPSRGLIYTTNIAEATASLTSSRPLPVYRVMNGAGDVLDREQDPNVSHHHIIYIQ